MSDGYNILNLLLLFAYLAVFGYLFKLFLFRAVRFALAGESDSAGGPQVFAAGNRINLFLAFSNLVLVLLPLALLIVVPGALRLLLGN